MNIDFVCYIILINQVDLMVNRDYQTHDISYLIGFKNQLMNPTKKLN